MKRIENRLESGMQELRVQITNTGCADEHREWAGCHSEEGVFSQGNEAAIECASGGILFRRRTQRSHFPVFAHVPSSNAVTTHYPSCTQPNR
jgi:hypothetical protein